jgi:hypothetical protein
MTQLDDKHEPAMKPLPPVGAYLCEHVETYAKYWLDAARETPDPAQRMIFAEQAVNGWKNLAYDLAKKAHYYLKTQAHYAEVPSAIEPMPQGHGSDEHHPRSPAAPGQTGSAAPSSINALDVLHEWVAAFDADNFFDECAAKDKAVRLLAGAPSSATRRIYEVATDEENHLLWARDYPFSRLDAPGANIVLESKHYTVISSGLHDDMVRTVVRPTDGKAT